MSTDWYMWFPAIFTCVECCDVVLFELSTDFSVISAQVSVLAFAVS